MKKNFYKNYKNLPKIKKTELDPSKKEIKQIINKLENKLKDSYPFFHPFYMGQMLKPPSDLARKAYELAMLVNSNNHALDGGPATTYLEIEIIEKFRKYFKFPNQSIGHLTGGGTLANMEALFIAKKIAFERNRKPIFAACENAHYTHSRLADLFEVEFIKIKSDKAGRMDIGHLCDLLKNHEISLVIATFGNTGFGSIDPVSEIAKLQEKYDFDIHIDAAYGGYFGLSQEISEYAKTQFNAIKKAFSIVIDPHKHGLLPYGCGLVLFANKYISKFFDHDSPYTYYSFADDKEAADDFLTLEGENHKKFHLGKISLECSRSGSVAASLWASLEYYQLEQKGVFAQRLDYSIKACQKFYEYICNSDYFFAILDPELDIINFALKGDSLTEISKKSEDFFSLAEKNNIYLSLIEVNQNILKENIFIKENVKNDRATLLALRSCFMKPEHFTMMDDIIEKMDSIILKINNIEK